MNAFLLRLAELGLQSSALRVLRSSALTRQRAAVRHPPGKGCRHAK
jgi:hypothetical protein